MYFSHDELSGSRKYWPWDCHHYQKTLDDYVRWRNDITALFSLIIVDWNLFSKNIIASVAKNTQKRYKLWLLRFSRIFLADFGRKGKRTGCLRSIQELMFCLANLPQEMKTTASQRESEPADQLSPGRSSIFSLRERYSKRCGGGRGGGFWVSRRGSY